MLPIRILFHCIPIVPVFFELYFLTVALVLLVAIFYVKTFKIGQQIEDFPKDGSEEELQELKTLRNRWKSLTFLQEDE
ncbi:hypothetical protein [Pseudobacteriovorax antillogorgiicola]|uniref:Uncharacterized protein n=1 Tax=Pseudobacteriovorax antillogorgiicola TaxID=1513793 RepID=A0A1Y6CHL9_9BACT|nr:hypothetical protein [Pseudobacteriovorax antillogorgiicola]TCS48614.1 hypothetical protein EDD56_11736 [Pseudobacteriovorax antillogorgiicola]SMF55478.1 hypothetical protein SAMN06296036_117123 [Pseudobacteriovorax antillogorgiicola]